MQISCRFIFLIQNLPQPDAITNLLMDNTNHSGDFITAVEFRRRRRGEKPRSPKCFPPWTILSRWISPFGSKFRNQKIGEDRGVESDDKDEQIKCSIHGSDEAPRSEESGKHRKTSFSSGIGLGLVCLVAVCTNEINKMMELRKQMEVLVHKLQEQFQIQTQEKTVSIPPLNSDNSPMIDQLEEELEAELEQLELHLDREASRECLKQQTAEIIIEDTAPLGSVSTSFEAVEFQEITSKRQNGVLPGELERRLHELLEFKQEERIKELEDALDCVENKLKEKEREISWWKDTALLATQHIPTTPRYFR